jgi:transcriptional regulator with PAS, ATPase and Fis domain
MNTPDWVKDFPAAITVCDANGLIVAMNDRAIATFEKDGGTALIGKNLLDCHPESSRTKLRELLASQRSNCYTIEKDGIHKLIYQSPWYDHGQYAGLVEISLEIPHPMPHFVRK